MVESLANCPFCGGARHHVNTKAKGYFIKKRAEREGRDPSNYLVRCTKCGAKGPLEHSDADAKSAWNRRDYSHIEVTDAMVEAGARAHCDHFGGEGWYSSGQAADSTEAMNAAMRLALTAALNVKEG